MRFARRWSNLPSGGSQLLGRRKLDISHPKLTEVLHRDFGDCSGLAEALSGQDAAVFCLGTYTGSGTVKLR
jgi:hypothetical protein